MYVWAVQLSYRENQYNWQGFYSSKTEYFGIYS